MAITLSNLKFTAGIGYDFAGGSAVRPFAGTFKQDTYPAIDIGSDPGEANKEYPPLVLTINSSTPVVLDLSSFTDMEGNAASLSEVAALIIDLKSTVAGEDVTVGGGTDPLLATLPVLKALARGSSVLFIATPITVDSTHKNLRIAAAAGTAVEVHVTIVGR